MIDSMQNSSNHSDGLWNLLVMLGHFLSSL